MSAAAPAAAPTTSVAAEPARREAPVPDEPSSKKARLTFFTKRVRIGTEAADKHKKTHKGQEVDIWKLALHLRAKFDSADLAEWRKHIEHEVFIVE